MEMSQDWLCGNIYDRQQVKQDVGFSPCICLTWWTTDNWQGGWYMCGSLLLQKMPAFPRSSCFVISWCWLCASWLSIFVLAFPLCECVGAIQGSYHHWHGFATTQKGSDVNLWNPILPRSWKTCSSSYFFVSAWKKRERERAVPHTKWFDCKLISSPAGHFLDTEVCFVFLLCFLLFPYCWVLYCCSGGGSFIGGREMGCLFVLFIDCFKCILYVLKITQHADKIQI